MTKEERYELQFRLAAQRGTGDGISSMSDEELATAVKDEATVSTYHYMENRMSKPSLKQLHERLGNLLDEAAAEDAVETEDSIQRDLKEWRVAVGEEVPTAAPDVERDVQAWREATR